MCLQHFIHNKKLHFFNPGKHFNSIEFSKVTPRNKYSIQKAIACTHIKCSYIKHLHLHWRKPERKLTRRWMSESNLNANVTWCCKMLLCHYWNKNHDILSHLETTYASPKIHVFSMTQSNNWCPYKLIPLINLIFFLTGKSYKKRHPIVFSWLLVIKTIGGNADQVVFDISGENCLMCDTWQWHFMRIFMYSGDSIEKCTPHLLYTNNRMFLLPRQFIESQFLSLFF